MRNPAKRFSCFAVMIGIIGIISLAGCQKAGENQLGSASREEDGKTAIQMEMDENYDVADPFVNARLFRVTEDMDALDAEVAFEMDGKSGTVEIKNHATDAVLWRNTWDGDAAHETLAISLADVQKGEEYAVYFTGTEITHAAVTVTFECGRVEEQVRPSA